MMATSDPLTYSLDQVRQHARRMEHAMEHDDMRIVLKAATDMLGELSSGQNPKNYSSLYAEVFTHIQQLPYYFQDYVSHGHDTFTSLYAIMQHAGHVLPRLYLMIVCGCCAMKADPGQVQYYLSDLLEFCKGVQNPMRGLFLRSFLNTSVRALLPDVVDASGVAKGASATSPGRHADGATSSEQVAENAATISMTFLLRNFSEMNKLWTRMQRNLPQSDARDTIRTQLAELVGKNLNQLASLNGLNFQHYEQLVLPCVTEQIVHCEDQLAQQYLMEIVILSFPDEYHLRTLDAVLRSCMLLQPGVEVHVIMSRLMERLADHAARADGGPAAFPDDRAFHCFLSAAHDCADKHKSMPAQGVVLMYLALNRFVASVYGGDVAMLNAILASCHAALRERGMVADAKAEALLLSLLMLPLQTFELDHIMELDNFPALLQALHPAKQRTVAAEVIASMRRAGVHVATAEQMRMLTRFTAPLLTAHTGLDAVEAAECMAHVAALARCISTADLPAVAAVAAALRDALPACPAAAAPLQALAFVFLDAFRARAPDLPPAARAHYVRYLHEQLIVVLEDSAPGAALHMLLRGAQLASDLADAGAAQHFLDCALAVYHRYCALPPGAADGLAVIVQAVLRLRVLPRARHDEVVDALCRYASSLPVREQRVQMLLAMSHLYWQGDEDGAVAAVRDEAAVQGVLARACEAAALAEKLYHGESWSNPAAMHMDIADTARCLRERGCDVATAEAAAVAEAERLSSEGCQSLGAVRTKCWNEDLQHRFEAMRLSAG